MIPWVPLLENIKNDYPQIENGTRILFEDVWVETNGKKFKEDITFADASLFDVFSFPVRSGNGKEIFKDKYSLIITKEIAKKYFGNENPVGKIVKLDFDTDYVIRGILKDIPENSSIPINLLANFDGVISPDHQLNKNWNSAFLFTYLKLKKGSSPEQLEKQLPQFVNKIWGEEGPNGTKQLQLKLLPLADLHYDENRTKSFVYILISIAAAIILIASFNFMNLSTARSFERVREIGMRKVLGAGKKQLIRQFIGESLLLTSFSLLIGIGLVELLLPFLNSLYEINLKFDYTNIATISVLAGTVFIVGIFSGSYPAFILSRFPVIDSIKGIVKRTGGSSFIRNILVTLQFAISIFLLIGTAVVWDQTNL